MREAGHYWVRNDSEWEIARWTGYSWWTVYSDDAYDDGFWSEIDERRLVREDPSDER